MSTSQKISPLNYHTPYPEFLNGYFRGLLVSAQIAGRKEVVGMGLRNLTSASFLSMLTDCHAFIAQTGEAFDALVGDTKLVRDAGHDFWFIRNRSHFGFFAPEIYGVALAAALTRAAQNFRPVIIQTNDAGELEHKPLLETVK